jgi:hypothetical protein
VPSNFTVIITECGDSDYVEEDYVEAGYVA